MQHVHLYGPAQELSYHLDIVFRYRYDEPTQTRKQAMATTGDDLADRVSTMLEDLTALSEAVSALLEDTHYQDLEHALLGLRIVRHALDETAEHAGLGGHIERIGNPALHERAHDLAVRLEALAQDSATFFGEHPNDDLEMAVVALTIAEGSFEEVVERYDTA
jgi:hypothetical protein